jgi:hemolysin III
MEPLLIKLIRYRSHDDVTFSMGWFCFFVTLQSALFFTAGFFLLRWLAPDVLAVQISAPWYSYILCFAALHLFNGLFEFFFHRYVLHSVFWESLKSFREKHTEHHRLTHVRELQTSQATDEQVPVRNKYPILTPEQIEHSAFPGYALLAFWALFSVILIPLQIALPGLPLLVTGYLGVVFSFSLYEIKHAVEHMDYEKHWRRRVENSKFFREWYGFHLMHHSRIRVNQAIGGVFCLPIWDWVFGTYFVPDELPLPEQTVSPASQIPPAPRQPIRWLDRVVDACEQRLKDRRKAAALK